MNIRILKIIFLIVIIVIILIILLILLNKKNNSNNIGNNIDFPSYMYNNSYYSPDDKNGFNGIKIFDLAQPESFYKQKYNDTLRYLNAVYPNGKKSFSLLTPLQIASFYNSLTFYYNCSFQYKDNDLGIIPGNLGGQWDSLSCSKDSPLPYPPQGYFYNFWTYQKYNMPYVYSDSDTTDKPYLELQNFGNCRVGLAFNTERKGKEYGIRAGPGMFWVDCRTIQRHIWYPNGFINNKIKFTDETDIWNTVLNYDISWNYPNNWLQGRNNNEYLEITHSGHTSGITTSPGWWYNGFTGTGIFVNLGKTARFNNKMGGVFGLAQMLSETDNGRQFLLNNFKTYDPYEIVFGFFGWKGYDKTKNILYCNTDIVPCYDCVGVDADKGISAESNTYLQSDFLSATIAYQNQHGISENYPTTEGIKMAIDAAVNMTDFNLYRFSVAIVPDEPMFYFALQLGIDTLQLPTDPNSNGYFVLEILDTRMPQKYKDLAIKRDYSTMINLLPNDKTQMPPSGISNLNLFNQTWNAQFITDCYQYFVDNKIFTIRDPLDINNDSKATSCDGLNDINLCPLNNFNNDVGNKNWLNLFCKNTLSDNYKCLSVGIDATGQGCQLLGDNLTC